MSKKYNSENTDLTSAISQIKNSEEKSSEASEAIKAIEMTSQIMEAIMAGRQIDISFYSAYANGSIKKIRRLKKNKLLK